MKKLLLSLSALFAAIPGLATILTGLGAPPGYKLIFGGVIEATGALALLVVAINKKRLQRKSVQYITRMIITFGTIFAVCLSVYLILIRLCIVADCEKPGEVFFPIWLRGELNEEVQARGGSRYDTLCKLQDWVRREISKAQVDANISAVILLFLYSGTTATLVLAFAYPGFYLKQPDRLLENEKPQTHANKTAN